MPMIRVQGPAFQCSKAAVTQIPHVSRHVRLVAYVLTLLCLQYD